MDMGVRGWMDKSVRGKNWKYLDYDSMTANAKEPEVPDHNSSSPHEGHDIGCHRFTIQRYVSQVREHNPKLCWPFKIKRGRTRSLPCMGKRNSRFWRCQHCVKELRWTLPPLFIGFSPRQHDNADVAFDALPSQLRKGDDDDMPGKSCQAISVNEDMDASSSIISAHDGKASSAGDGLAVEGQFAIGNPPLASKIIQNSSLGDEDCVKVMEGNVVRHEELNNEGNVISLQETQPFGDEAETKDMQSHDKEIQLKECKVVETSVNANAQTLEKEMWEHDKVSEASVASTQASKVEQSSVRKRAKNITCALNNPFESFLKNRNPFEEIGQRMKAQSSKIGVCADNTKQFVKPQLIRTDQHHDSRSCKDSRVDNHSSFDRHKSARNIPSYGGEERSANKHSRHGWRALVRMTMESCQQEEAPVIVGLSHHSDVFHKANYKNGSQGRESDRTMQLKANSKIRGSQQKKPPKMKSLSDIISTSGYGGGEGVHVDEEEIPNAKKIRKANDPLHSQKEATLLSGEFIGAKNARKKRRVEYDDDDLFSKELRKAIKASKEKKVIVDSLPFLEDSSKFLRKSRKKKPKHTSEDLPCGDGDDMPMSTLPLEKSKSKYKIQNQTSGSFSIMQRNSLAASKPAIYFTGETSQIQGISTHRSHKKRHRVVEDLDSENSFHVEDGIPMDIVELMAKNQHERAQSSHKKVKSMEKMQRAVELNQRNGTSDFKNNRQGKSKSHKKYDEHKKLFPSTNIASLKNTEKHSFNDVVIGVSFKEKDRHATSQSYESFKASGKFSEQEEFPLFDGSGMHSSLNEQNGNAGYVTEEAGLAQGKTSYSSENALTKWLAQNIGGSRGKDIVAFQSIVEPEPLDYFSGHTSLVPKSSFKNKDFTSPNHQDSIRDPSSHYYHNVYSNSALLQQVNENARKMTGNNSASPSSAPVLRLMGQSLTLGRSCRNGEDTRALPSSSLGPAQSHTNYSWLRPSACFPLLSNDNGKFSELQESNDYNKAPGSSTNLNLLGNFSPNYAAPHGTLEWSLNQSTQTSDFSFANILLANVVHSNSCRDFFNISEINKNADPEIDQMLYGLSPTHGSFNGSYYLGNNIAENGGTVDFISKEHPATRAYMVTPLMAISPNTGTSIMEICPLNMNPAEIIVEVNGSESNDGHNLCSHKFNTSSRKRKRLKKQQQVEGDRNIHFGSYNISSPNNHYIVEKRTLPLLHAEAFSNAFGS